MIELMIALFLSSCLMSTIFAIYLANKQSMQTQTNIRTQLANADTALGILTNNLKKTGYIGCQRLMIQTPITSHLSQDISINNKLIGNANQLTIRYAAFTGVTLEQLSANRSILTATHTFQFSPGDRIIISDCQHVEMALIASIYFLKDIQKIIVSSPLQNSFDAGAEIDLFAINHYFLKKTNRYDENKKPIFALFEENIQHQKQEIVDNIEQLNFKYWLQDGTYQTQISNSQNLAGIAILMTTKIGQLEKNWSAYAALS